jgi:hypothetical protein
VEALECRTLLASPPFANNDNAATPGNTPVLIHILANDTDPNPGGMLNPASVVIVSGPGHGSTSPDTTTGDVTYTPNTGFSGEDMFTYTVADNFNQTSNVATVTVEVTAGPPVAKNDNATTPVSTPVLINVLANDTDPNAGGVLNPASVRIVAGPSHSHFVPPSVDTSTGAITYTPDPVFSGFDQFSYTVVDNFGLTSNVATVTIQVTASPPIANNDSAVTAVNAQVPINVVTNDTDPNPGGVLDPSSVLIVTGPGHGVASLSPTKPGFVNYAPNPGFTGMDQLSYTVSDNFGLISNVATVTILVTTPNYQPPAANNDNAVTRANAPVVINVLANDTDPNPGGKLNPASVVIVAGPGHGSTSLNTTTGAVTYTPTAGFGSGTDQFMYTVSDNFGLTSNVATVTILVGPSITATGTRFQVYPGLPLNIVTVATFTETNLTSTLPRPSATIDWGDGPPTTGTVSNPDSIGVYTVTGTHEYSTAFTSQFAPGTALPVTVTLTDSEDNTATASSSAILLSSGTGNRFTGGLAVTPTNGPNAAGGYATTAQPIFSGTAPPSSIVQLSAQSVFSAAAPTPLVQAVTSASGSWSVTVPAGSLGAGVYQITATVTIPGVFQSGPISLANGGRITIDTSGPSVPNNTASLSTTMGDQGIGQVTINFNGGFSGMNLPNLLRRDNYRFFGRALVAQHPKSLALGGSSTDSEGHTVQMLLLTIQVKPKLLKKLMNGTRTIQLQIVRTDYVRRGSGPTVNIGVTDNVGNPLQGGVVTIRDMNG